MLQSLFLLLLATAGVQGAPAMTPAEEAEFCLSCHGDPDLAKTLPSGETLSLFVDMSHVTQSVHADSVACRDCHGDMTDQPHPERPFRTRREYEAAYHENCKRCHFANYARTLDSVHHAAVARGDRTVPLCADCHGSHGIRPPDEPRALVSKTCAQCHQGVYSVFMNSVHGKGIDGPNGADVPVCTDCHRAHDVAGPTDQAWRMRTPDVCGTCHADAELMKKYGISPNVNQTYLADFHGMTASAQRENPGPGAALIAVCTDCHGVHDITRADDPQSRVIKANLVKTCQRCHEGATENFPAAWLSHYEPTFEKAPLVFGVKLAYFLIIPFMIGGLVLQVLLHLWRVVVNR